MRTFEIMSAVEPTLNPGYFYKAFENTMNKFCSDLTKTEMVRYIAVDPSNLNLRYMRTGLCTWVFRKPFSGAGM